MARRTRFELVTCGSVDRRSIHLSYRRLSVVDGGGWGSFPSTPEGFYHPVFFLTSAFVFQCYETVIMSYLERDRENVTPSFFLVDRFPWRKPPFREFKIPQRLNLPWLRLRFERDNLTSARRTSPSCQKNGVLLESCIKTRNDLFDGGSRKITQGASDLLFSAQYEYKAAFASLGRTYIESSFYH